MQKEKVLITVKTYPTLSSTYGELACTAGIKEDGSWIRLYPIPFRRLKEDCRFEKYAWIEIPIVKNNKDPRPESYRPTDLSQIKRLEAIGTENKWQLRKEIILRKLVCYKDIEELIQKAKENELSLALFKPTKVIDFVWEEVEREWDSTRLKKVLAELDQGLLFTQEEFLDDFTIVEKIPYKFSYVFEDSNGKQRKMMIEDWEVGALYRNCMKSTDSESKALEKVREKYLNTFLKKAELHFFLGTTQQWHFRGTNPFIIIGTFTPPKDNQTYLDFK